MAIGDNNEKYYSPTYTPTTYASNDYAAQNYGDGGYWGGDYYDPDKPPVTQSAGEANVGPEGNMIKREGGEHDPNPPSGEPEVRDFDNNFGYESLGLLGDIASIGGKVIGGPVGMALGAPGKIADVRNLSAVQSARKALGLETTEVGAKNVLGAMAKGTPSHVGTVSIGGVQYDVDLDPDKQGKINPKTGVATISPKEAQTIKTENKVEMTEIAAPETPAAPKGPLGKTMQAVKDKVSNIAQSVLGNPQAATTKTVKEAVETSPVAPSVSPSTPSVAGATPGYNPAAPSPAQNVGLNAQPANPAEVSRSITPGLGLGNLTPTRDVTATAPVAGGISHLGGVANVGKRNTKDVPGLQDKTTVQNTPQEQRGTISSANPAGKGRYASPEANTMQGVANVMADVMGPDYGLSINSGTYTPAHAQKIEATRVAATQQAKSMGLTGQALKDHVKDAVSAVGGVGSPRHSTTLAGDYTASQIGSGKKATRAQMAAFANEAFSKGYSVGYGKNYMGEDVVHIDDTRPTNPNYWGGFTPTKDAMAASRNVAQQRGIMADYSGIGVPGTREMALQGLETPADQLSNVAAGVPSAIADVGVTEARNKDDTVTPSAYSPSVAENPSLDSMSNVTAGVGSMTPGLAMGTMADDPTANVGVSQDMGTIGQGLAAMNAGYTPGTAMSPSNFSSIGMGYQYSPAEVSKMGYALAGELDSTSLKGLMENNPTAISELASMVSTVDNRVNSLTSMVKDNPLDAALNPSQYNSMMPSKQNVTAANYAQFGQKVNETIQGLLDGSVKATNVSQQANNYANMSLSNPSWADPNMAKDEAQRTAALGFKDTAVTTGAHTFGGYGLGVGAPQNAAGYGTSFGPNAATSVTGKSGLSHSPGSMYGGATTTAGTPGGYAAEGANALGGSLGLGGGYVDSGSLSSTGETNSGLGGTSSSANGNTAGSGDSGSSSSGNGNSSGSGGGSDGAGSSGSSGGLGGRGGDNDHDGGDGRGR